MPLISMALWPGDVQVRQRISLSKPEGSTSLMAVLALSPQRMTVVGVSALDYPVFLLEFDGNEIRTSGEQGDQLPARLVLASIQFALWPSEAVAGAYRDDWHYVEDGNYRRAYYQGDLVAGVERDDWHGAWPNHVRIRFSKPTFEIDIVTVDFESL